MSFLHSMEQRGFAIISGVFSPYEMHQLVCDIEGSALKRSKAGIRHALRLPSIAAIANDSRLLGSAAEILGTDATPFRATLFDKSPHANWLVVWHQDTALPLREVREVPGWGPWSTKDGITYAHAPATALSRVVTLRVHIDDCTLSNGPLRALPGTHQYGVLSDDAIQDLTATIPAEDCLVPAGGVLAMRPLLVHASSKSQSKARRRILHIEYARCGPIAEGLELAVA